MRVPVDIVAAGVLIGWALVARPSPVGGAPSEPPERLAVRLGTFSRAEPLIEFRADRSVWLEGEHVADVADGEVREFWDRLESSGFWTTPVHYQGRGCVTCGGTPMLTVVADGRKHAVSYDDTCADPTTEALGRVTRRLLEWAGVVSPLPDDLGAAVARLGPEDFAVDRDALEDAIASGFPGLRLVRRDDGTVSVFGVRRDSLWGRLGLQNGDSFRDLGTLVAQPFPRIVEPLGPHPMLVITFRRRGRGETLRWHLR